MKQILRKIIKKYFGNTDNLYDFGENLFLVIDNDKGEPSDFYYFIFNDDISSIKMNIFSSIFNELKQNKIDNNIMLGEIESFDKNLNFIIFSKIADDGIGKIGEKLEKKAYEIEDDAYYARKKVMFYTQDQIDNFDNYSLNITENISGKVESNINESNNRFLLNLLSTLTFIKMEFKNSSSTDNNIYENSFKSLNENINLFEEGLNLVNQESLHDKIIEINNTDYKDEDLYISEAEISEFEKDLIGLFNDNNELEKNILNPLITEEDEK